MSGMTIEEARRITKACPWLRCPHQKCALAYGFIRGHASRDPEVEKLEAATNCLRLLKDQAKAEAEKLKSYTEKKFTCPCGETTYLLEQNPNHFVGCISHNPTEVEKLKAERLSKLSEGRRCERKD